MNDQTPPSGFDLVVVGSGPGGYVAAIRAAQLGLRTALVEKDAALGGTCLHRGCIPTKAFLHTADILDEIRDASRIGIRTGGDPALDPAGLQAYKKKTVTKLAKGIDFLMRKNGVTVVSGFGRLTGPRRVAVRAADGSETTLEAARGVLIATGSVPRTLPGIEIDGELVLSSDHVLELERVPESLIVLGAGAVGVEFASIFARFGAKVTIVELLPRLVPLEDEEVSAELATAFRRRKITVATATKVVGVERAGGKLVVRTESEAGVSSTLQAEKLLVAVGRAPVTSGIGLEEVGVVVDRGYVQVDPFMRTSVDGIYAIGDIVPTPWLAHVASQEGIVAVEHLAGADPRPIDYGKVPMCTYSSPEIGSVGLSETRARERGDADVVTGKFGLPALGKAQILGAREGFVKIVADRKWDEILGVHIVGPSATELVAEAVACLQAEMTVEELTRTIHAHPTVSEGIKEAAEAVLGHAIHGA